MFNSINNFYKFLFENLNNFLKFFLKNFSPFNMIKFLLFMKN